jgi:hypothetical protein
MARLVGQCHAEPPLAPDRFQPTLLRRSGFQRQVKRSVRAPSEAWRFWQGARPCQGRSHPPPVPRVASVQEVHSRTTQVKRTQGTTEPAREPARPAA